MKRYPQRNHRIFATAALNYPKAYEKLFMADGNQEPTTQPGLPDHDTLETHLPPGQEKLVIINQKEYFLINNRGKIAIRARKT